MAIGNQHGVISRAQAHAAGITDDVLKSRVDHGVWQRLHRGVFATFSGPVPHRSRVWAVLLAAGDDATLSHQSAAELHGLIDSVSEKIHITIPNGRHVKQTLAGAVVHRSRRILSARQPNRSPPRTRLEETVFDLAESARTIDEAVHWMAIACGRRLTTAARLRAALTRRSRVKWRRELAAALDDIGLGCQSLLELRYLQDVEKAHRLPRGERQSKHARDGGNIYDDVRYAEFGLVIELDGRVAHPTDAYQRDRSRDNHAADRGESVLHFGWGPVTDTPCQVAARVAAALTARGWYGRPQPCRRHDCMIVGRSEPDRLETAHDHAEKTSGPAAS